MKQRNMVLDYLAYLAVRIVTALFHMFPIDLNLRTARALGDLMWWVINRDLPIIRKVLKHQHRQRIMNHLRLALGEEYSEEQLQQIARQSCRHLVMFAVECLFTPRLITIATWSRYVRLKNFSEALRLMLQDKGVIMLTGHYGSWELLGFTLAALGFDIVAVMRPLDNPFLNRYLLGIRERRGLRLLYKKGAAANMEDVLADGSALCFIADQDAGRKGIFVDFFGRPASTYRSIALVAIQHEAPIVVGCARRISDRFLYEIDVQDVIYPHEWQDHDDPVHYITQRYTAAIEEMVRIDPTQYLWLHRRWKTQPGRKRGTPRAKRTDAHRSSIR